MPVYIPAQTGGRKGAFVRAGYQYGGLILPDHPVDATVDNAGIDAGLMVAIVLPRYLPQASNNRATVGTPLKMGNTGAEALGTCLHLGHPAS